MNTRIVFYDVTKAFAIFSVIAYHVAKCMHLETISTFLDTFFLSLFFFISGLWLDDIRRFKDLIKIIKDNSVRLILPFFICITLYSYFQIIIRDGQLSNLFNYWLYE